MTDKIDLTEEYRDAQEVISKLGRLIAHGHVDVEWILEQARENAKKQAQEIKKRRIPVKKKF